MNRPVADQAITNHPGDRATFTSEAVKSVFVDLGLDVHDLDILIEQGLNAQAANDRKPFEVRVAGWALDLPTAVARGVINGAVLAGLLAAVDETSVPATVLSVVVPFVFDLQRVTVSRSDKTILAVLLRDPWGREPIEDWYQTLPEHLRDEITQLEFNDIIDRLEDAGLVEIDDYNVVTVDQPPPRRTARLGLPPTAESR